MTGRPAQVSFCQQGTTLNVSAVRRIGNATPQPQPQPPVQDIAISGRLTSEGLTCQAMRDGSGRLYTLTGDLKWFHDGDFVRITGRVAQASICRQGTTIEVRSIASQR